MEISPVSRNVGAVTAVASPVHSEQMSEQRETIQAVKAINGSQMLGPDNELTFQRDRNTQRMVIRVVNRQTGDVVTQVPPEYVLRLAEELHNQTKSKRK